jgi:hypothetical protein
MCTKRRLNDSLVEPPNWLHTPQHLASFWWKMLLLPDMRGSPSGGILLVDRRGAAPKCTALARPIRSGARGAGERRHASMQDGPRARTAVPLASRPHALAGCVARAGLLPRPKSRRGILKYRRFRTGKIGPKSRELRIKYFFRS